MTVTTWGLLLESTEMYDMEITWSLLQVGVSSCELSRLQEPKESNTNRSPKHDFVVRYWVP